MLLERADVGSAERDAVGADGLDIAYVSTYPPRECGLASFCEDLLTATMLDSSVGEPMVVAMEDGGRARDYRWPVVMIVEDDREAHYVAAAEFLSKSRADVVSVQHEFGIYGGPSCRGLRAFLERVTKPVVSTLHTVVAEPEREVRESIRFLADRSHRLVVMNALATETLMRDYGVERGKVAQIHHGALPPAEESRDEAKAALGLSGRRVLTTFGLVGRGKGLEYVVGALPEILREHPDACYVIVGQTHPGVKRAEKESYREELVRLAAELGVEDGVRFVNRYVSKSEIARYLAATDIYVTPYVNPVQITSGTLAYAVTAGKAIVSTPYAYARFLLEEAGGLLVEFRSARAIAEAANRVLARSDLQGALERESRRCGERMLWPAVGAEYVSLFAEAVREQRSRGAARPLAERQLALPMASGREGHRDAGRSRPSTVAGSLTTAD